MKVIIMIPYWKNKAWRLKCDDLRVYKVQEGIMATKMHLDDVLVNI